MSLAAPTSSNPSSVLKERFFPMSFEAWDQNNCQGPSGNDVACDGSCHAYAGRNSIQAFGVGDGSTAFQFTFYGAWCDNSPPIGRRKVAEDQCLDTSYRDDYSAVQCVRVG